MANRNVGTYLIGFSAQSTRNSSVLPSPTSVEEVRTIMAEFLYRLEKVESRTNLQVDNDRVLAAINLTDEDVYIRGDKIAITGEVSFFDWVRDLNGNPTGTIDPSFTTIIGDKIRTGTVEGNAWSASAGIQIDLDNDTIKLGGSSAPKFSVSSAGALTSTSGNIGGFSIGATTLTGGTTNIILDSSNKAISINSATYGSDGVQIQYNAGDPRIYIGDGTSQFFKFDGTNVSFSGTNCSLTAGGTFTASSASITGAISTSNITATGGTIGSWIIGTDLLKSTASGARIELNKTKSRISIFDSSAEKVAMGYLDGLAKNASGGGTWGAGDYGFWALNGDKLVIDGDAEYQAGDWIIKNDGSYLIQDSLNNTIIRLGTDTGEKGLFIYNTSGTKLAKLISDSIYIGTTGAYIQYTVAGGLDIVGDISATSTVNISGYLVATGTSTQAPYSNCSIIGKPGTTSYNGVLGMSTSGKGVIGASTSSYGVAGYSDSSYGVYGFSDTGSGLQAMSNSGYGVEGICTASGGIGIFGLTTDGIGVKASRSIGGSGTALAIYGPMTIDADYGTISNLDADQLDNRDAGNGNGNIPISNGTVCTNLVADKLDGDYDYAEGTWTPTLVTTGTGFDSITYDTGYRAGKYAKMGNFVYIVGRLRTDAITVGSASGNLRIGGLPFTASSDDGDGIAISRSEAWATNNPCGGAFVDSGTTIDLFYRSAANGATLSLPVSDAATGTDANLISFSGFYKV